MTNIEKEESVLKTSERIKTDYSDSVRGSGLIPGSPVWSMSKCPCALLLVCRWWRKKISIYTEKLDECVLWCKVFSVAIKTITLEMQWIYFVVY